MLSPNVLHSLISDVPEMELKWREPLARYTTFRVGGPVLCLARPRTEDALIGLVRKLREHDVPYFILGGGSNVLLPDDQMNVVAIQLDLCSAKVVLKGKPENSQARASVGAGVRLPRLLRYTLHKGLGGLEFFVGIPGTVGGALIMNAGTRDGTISDVLLSIDILDEKNQRRRVPRLDLSPGYRSMGLPDDWVIFGCCLGVKPRADVNQRARLFEMIQERKKSQPLGWPSAGCVFKNPQGFAAGALIEKAGLKGFRIGDAEVSPKHANWIINRGRARARDVIALIEHIENRVERDCGIRLEREIRIVGP